VVAVYAARADATAARPSMWLRPEAASGTHVRQAFYGWPAAPGRSRFCTSISIAPNICS
jgi:hypothetical protein